MIYPTSRAVFLTALGIPIALLLAILAPRLWLAGATWVIFVLLLVLFDAAMAGIPRILRISAGTPGSLAVGQTSRAVFDLRFGRFAAPRSPEVTLDVGERLVASPPRQRAVIDDHAARTEFALSVKRRGQGRLESVSVRWRGPIGLAWVQKREQLDRTIPIVLNLQSVKEEVIRLFRRDAQLGAHLQFNAADGSEFHALRSFESGMDRRTIDWKQSARHGVLLAKEFQAEKNQHIIVALDTGRLMSEPVAGAPRLDIALQAM